MTAGGTVPAARPPRRQCGPRGNLNLNPGRTVSATDWPGGTAVTDDSFQCPAHTGTGIMSPTRPAGAVAGPAGAAATATRDAAGIMSHGHGHYRPCRGPPGPADAGAL